MSTMIERLIETIEKDIQDIESNSKLEKKIIRKECSLLKQRIISLKKFKPKEIIINDFEMRIEKILQSS
ncbi:hypothetical protein [Halobacteriovorax sp. HLS]|uniref:hypothetical protein n=1 Tax=Halobacteriovorax sp. HLS TaxID=2234000 RepID=UPI000FD75AB6|nr:hypothetical protein [Halobacteriovorax sp. HLS]